MFLNKMKQLYVPDRIKGEALAMDATQHEKLRVCIDGQFGAMMDVGLTNEV